MAKVTMIEAINRAHAWEMAHDPTVVVLGEDIGVNGGVFRATAGLQEKFGKDRVQDTPLAEGMIAGMSLGMASQGLRPIAEIQFMGFIYPAMDQIANHMARMRHRTRAASRCRWFCACLMAAAFTRLSITRRASKRCWRIIPGCACCARLRRRAHMECCSRPFATRTR